MTPAALGSLVHSFFDDYLKKQKGLCPNSLKSYADAMRLFLQFASKSLERKITKLKIDDLGADLVSSFLNFLEESRGNAIQSRNQRLGALRVFFEYVGGRLPDKLALAQRVAAIPRKRVQPPETIYLEREEIENVLASLPPGGRRSLRDRSLLLFLYNTGARVCKRQPTFGRPTFNLARTLVFDCTARAISGASALCGRRQPPC